MPVEKQFREGEVVLVLVDQQPSFFARIEKIVPDIKKGWWRVTFLVLAMPLTAITWILDENQIRGADFTMGGTPIRLDRVVAPQAPEIAANENKEQEKSKQDSEGGKAKIISLTDR